MIFRQIRSLLFAGTVLSFSFATPAAAQGAPPPAQPTPVEAPAEDEPVDELDGEEIVVTGGRRRGTVVGDIPPENILGTRDVRATGATDITELLEAIAPQIGSARGRGGERPILLLNGQRISGFRELRDIPTEAIQRVEILPEEVALKYGYRADQRVVNFILRERFRSTAVRAEGRTATEGGYVGGLADATRLMIDRGSRTTVNLRAEGNSLLTEDERDILLDSAEQEPVLDPRNARSLVGERKLVRGTVTHNRTILGNVSTTGNVEYEHSDGRSLLGFPRFSDGIILPNGVDPRGRDTVSDSAHAGVALNWDKADWRWSVTGNADIARKLTSTDPDDFDPAVEFARNRARSIVMTGNVDAVANGSLFELPAGEVGATFKVGARTFDIDSSQTNRGEFRTSALGRSASLGSVNVDVPISRRNRDFSALGNLTLNANAEVEQLSDFGTLLTIGSGLNWSPVERLNLIASVTREEGAPTVPQLGDPVLETPGSRIFDFTNGDTVLLTAITGGNPNLEADQRNVLKIGGNWKPFTETDLRLRAEFVRSRLRNPISSFPGPSAALEAAFPERFVRDADGDLSSADLRPVNFDESRRDTLRWGFDFSKPLQSKRPSPAQIAQLRAQRAAGRANARPSATPPGTAPAIEGAPATAESQRAGGRRGGGGGFGRFGGGGGRGQGGRLQFSLTHSLNLQDEVTIRPGIAELDYLGGDALGSAGGRPRHEIEAQAGYSNNGLGARLSADWRSGTEVDSASAGTLRFSPLTTFDLRLFANLGERFDLVTKHPWLRGTQVRLEVNNLLDSKQRVRDAAGDVPFNYQQGLLNPLGRTIAISIRKLFSPAPGTFRRRERSGS